MTIWGKNFKANAKQNNASEEEQARSIREIGKRPQMANGNSAKAWKKTTHSYENMLSAACKCK